MTPILQALLMGHNAQSILSFLQSTNPQFGNRINRAKKSGHSDEDILKYLSKIMHEGEMNTEGMSTPQIEAANRKRQGNITKKLAKTAIGAAVGFGVGRALPAVAQGLRGVFNGPVPPFSPPGSNLPSPVPAIGPRPMGGAPIQPPPIPPVGPIQPQAKAPTPSPMQPMAPPTASPVNPQQSIRVLDEMGLGSRVKSLTNAGNQPDIVSAFLDHIMTPGQKKWLSDKVKAGEAKPLQEMVMDYLSAQPQQQRQEIQPNQGGKIPTIPPQGVLQPEIKAEERVEPIKKGDEVIDLENGEVGTLKDLKQKEGLLDVEGKLHKVKAENLGTIPKDWKNIHIDVSEVPESERSAALSMVAPLPGNKGMLVRYFQGHKPQFYLYRRKDDQPISQDTIDRISLGLDAPISSGIAFGGAWDPSKADSRGSANHHLLKIHSQSIEDKGTEKEDSEKQFWFEEVPISFMHGYHKAFEKDLLRAEKEFNEKFKPSKRKKPKTRKS